VGRLGSWRRRGNRFVAEFILRMCTAHGVHKVFFVIFSRNALIQSISMLSESILMVETLGMLERTIWDVMVDQQEGN
jgi:hypothetical protein